MIVSHSELGPSAYEKRDALDALLASFDSACIGYSGGVDSAFLAARAVAVLGAPRVLAVTGLSASVPEVQRAMARRCAAEFGIPHLEVSTGEVEDPRYAANPSDRCYFCKTELWTRLAAVAAERHLAVVLDGANADDASDYRPGRQATREHAVRSPLLEAGLTKMEIRAWSRAMGLPTWDQPAAPCLASRLPYGLAVTPERLGQVEAAERLLRADGFIEFRVRHHGEVARLEFARAELPRALRRGAWIDRELKVLGFRHVALDVEGYRRGALNEALPLVRLARVRDG